jgi:hypothetical protein
MTEIPPFNQLRLTALKNLVLGILIIKLRGQQNHKNLEPLNVYKLVKAEPR